MRMSCKRATFLLLSPAKKGCVRSVRKTSFSIWVLRSRKAENRSSCKFGLKSIGVIKRSYYHQVKNSYLRKQRHSNIHSGEDVIQNQKLLLVRMWMISTDISSGNIRQPGKETRVNLIDGYTYVHLVWSSEYLTNSKADNWCWAQIKIY